MKRPEDADSRLIITSPRYSGESALAHVLRVAELNGYTNASTIRKLLENRTGGGVRLAPDIAADPLVMMAWSYLIDSPAPAPVLWKRIASAAGKYFNIGGTSIPADALMMSRSQICPLCLSHEGYSKEEWDLSGVTVCTIHTIALLDRCHQCHKALRPVRIPLHTCSYCLADLRFAPTSIASDGEVAMALDIGALAPYRLNARHELIVDTAESLFAIAQAFSFDTLDVLQGKWNRTHFNKLPIESRRAALLPLTHALTSGVLNGDLLHRKLQEHIAHRLPYLPRAHAAEPLTNFLNFSEFLSVEARNCLSVGTLSPILNSAAKEFFGRPPQFSFAVEVMEFLGCSESTWRWLLRKQYIHLPQNDLNFDADEILNARTRLSWFLSFDELDSRFGVIGLTERLVRWHVLTEVAGFCSPSRMVDSMQVGQVLDGLRMQSIQNSALHEDEWIPISSTGLAMADLTEAYAVVFARALRGDIQALRWRAPYRLADLSISHLDADSLRGAA